MAALDFINKATPVIRAHPTVTGFDDPVIRSLDEFGLICRRGKYVGRYWVERYFLTPEGKALLQGL